MASNCTKRTRKSLLLDRTDKKRANLPPGHQALELEVSDRTSVVVGGSEQNPRRKGAFKQ